VVRYTQIGGSFKFVSASLGVSSSSSPRRKWVDEQPTHAFLSEDDDDDDALLVVCVCAAAAAVGVITRSTRRFPSVHLRLCLPLGQFSGKRVAILSLALKGRPAERKIGDANLFFLSLLRGQPYLIIRRGQVLSGRPAGRPEDES